MKYLGIDFGMRKTGLALGDGVSGVAVPLSVIAGGEKTLPTVLKLITDEGVEAVVVGLPIAESHQSPEQFERVQAFIAALKEKTSCPVFAVDERFSSTEARRVQREFGATASEDALAAMLILQAHLDEESRA